MNMRGVISFDLDGVLANFIRGYMRVGNQLFGTPVGNVSNQQSWVFEEFPELELTKHRCEEIWKHVWADPNFWANLDPLDVSVMPDINSIRNKVFVTNRAGINPAQQSELFLTKWGVYYPSVHLAADKVPIMKQLNVVATVDDYVVNCRELKTAIPSMYVAMLWTPYNEVYHTEMMALGVDIVLSVEQFIEKINGRGLVEN